MSENSPIINPEDVIKKEARGIDNADLGEVQEVGIDYIVTQKGILDKDKYYIPKNLVDHFDGHNVFFRITEKEAKQYKQHETNLI